MSRSNPSTNLNNPAQRYFEWSGSKGKLKYWDKTAGPEGKGEEVFVNLPFTFIVLDRLSCITGFNEKEKSRFWSNEIRDTRTDKFVVRLNKGIVKEGLYKDFADIKNQGAAYAQSVYIAYYEGKELTIGNFRVTGSAIGPWIDLCDEKNLEGNLAVCLSGATPKVKGATHYFEPVYTTKECSEETVKRANELDITLQEYLTAYFNKQGTLPPADATNGNGTKGAEIAPEDVVTNKQKADINNIADPAFGADNIERDSFGAPIINDNPDDLPF